MISIVKVSELYCRKVSILQEIMFDLNSSVNFGTLRDQIPKMSTRHETENSERDHRNGPAMKHFKFPKQRSSGPERI